MDELVKDMQEKGLITVKRVPKSEKLAKIICMTKAIPYWDKVAQLDFAMANRN